MFLWLFLCFKSSLMHQNAAVLFDCEAPGRFEDFISSRRREMMTGSSPGILSETHISKKTCSRSLNAVKLHRSLDFTTITSLMQLSRLHHPPCR